MIECDLLVAGGGPAGLAAVRGFRKHHGHGNVVLASVEQHLPYTRPSLSKEFLRGEQDIEDLPIERSDFYGGVDLRLGEPVVTLDTRTRTAVLAGGAPVRYANCVLATGSQPKPLPVPGADDARVFLLRSLSTAHRLRAAAAAASTAVVVGSGFIGCEAAASLARRGLSVTMASREELPQQARLGRAAAQRIADWLRAEGVRLVLGIELAEIHDGRWVRFTDHEPVTGDLILCAGGISPRVDIARTAGVPISDGRVLADDRMRTGAPGLFVAGDAAFALNRAAGRRLTVEHWGEALRMGEIAGGNAGGGDECWEQVPGFWTEIGNHTLKYAAWGDGFDEARVVDHGADAFTVWYGREGKVVGALTFNADDDYERASELAARGAPMAQV